MRLIHQNMHFFDLQVGADLCFAQVSGRFIGLPSKIDGLKIEVKCFANVVDANERNNETNAGRERRYFGPVGSLPLGLQIGLLAPFIAIGVWIAWWGLIWGEPGSGDLQTFLAVCLMFIGSILAISCALLLIQP